MRRTSYIAIAIAILALGVGAYFVFQNDGSNTNTVTTNTNGTVVNAAPNPGLILGVTPAKGPAAGGTKVTLTGEGFRGTPKVLFGEVEGKEVVVKSEKEITVVTPKNVKGNVDVTLKNATGPTSTVQGGFTFE